MPDIDKPVANNDSIVWRVLSWKYLGGGYGGVNLPYKHQYMFDNLVVSERLPSYLKRLEERGIEYIKLEKKGTLSWCLENLHWEPRPGAKSINYPEHNKRLDEYGIY
jgi:hypothetical protein